MDSSEVSQLLQARKQAGYSVLLSQYKAEVYSEQEERVPSQFKVGSSARLSSNHSRSS